MHRLSHINIANYQACRNVSLPLESYTPFVGQNIIGKSTILNAIRWVLRPVALAAGEFFQPSEPVSVSACIESVLIPIREISFSIRRTLSINSYLKIFHTSKTNDYIPLSVYGAQFKQDRID